MIRRTLLLLIMAVATQAFAQRKLVVVDVETLIPVVGANVVSKDGTTTTDSLGYFSVSDSCRSLAFSHVNYEPRMINLTEVRDTVYLISKLLNVREVVVFEAALAAADPSAVNLLPLLARLIPKKWRRNKKEERLKRLKQILEDY